MSSVRGPSPEWVAGAGPRPGRAYVQPPSIQPPRRRFCLQCLIGCLAVAGAGARAADHRAGEARVKAEYLHRFLGFVRWPAGAHAGPQAPHVVAVMGADDVLDELLRLSAARGPVSPGRRPVVVRRVAAGDPLQGVHLLHVGRGARPGLPEALRAWPLLVVTDASTGLPDWAMVNFVTVEQRVRFEASPQAAERAGLKLSARLLAVAVRVVAP